MIESPFQQLSGAWLVLCDSTYRSCAHTAGRERAALWLRPWEAVSNCP